LNYVHKSVMIKEVVSYLINEGDQYFLDCTIGEGGHSESILTRFPGIKIYGLDRDNEILNIAGNRLSNFRDRIVLKNINFKNINSINLDNKFFDSALIDLGISTYHYKKSQKGFSFSKKEFLNMMLDNESIDVKEIVNQYSEKDLIEIFFKYGEERFSKRIVSKIVEYRNKKDIKYSDELADIIYNAIPKKFHNKKIHPATKCFQALRIYANREFENIKEGLPSVMSVLKKNGRLGVITFHSLEDRIVKNIFNYLYKDCICPNEVQICTCGKKREISWVAKCLKPSKDEVDDNPSSRSAKLRVVQKL